ncbi:O-antigen ligase family protein [Salinibacter ruber]|uniref:O-antigen ligase-related domain-containing protein n=1 Tax=Salinibacter ruber TaxID=146919 RepID=A0A9X2U6T5_9BACT|nr:O-antigen ligase family protein [Salinibacter ruber]MCS3950919.1 hypothetical protein [Salinibacter ruber]
MTIEENIRIPRPVAAGIGFFIPFNVYLLPWSAQTPRATDLVGAAFLVTVAVLLLMGLRLSRRLAVRILFVAVLLLPMFWHGLRIGELSALIDAIRWVVGFGWALGLTWMARSNRLRSVVFKGIILGTVGCVVVIVMQVVGLTSLTISLGWAAQDAVLGTSWAGILRVPGLEPNVNGSAAVVSLCVPIALGLLDEGRVSRIWLFVALGTVVTGSALTLNRSSILVSGVTVSTWVFLAGKQSIRTGWKVSAVLLIVTGLAVYGPPGGWKRWNELASLNNLTQSQNFQVRVRSTLYGLHLLSDNLLGIGRDYQGHIERYMRSYMRNSTTSPHNAFLQIGLMAGLPLMLWVVWKLGIRILSLLRRGSVETWLSLHLFGLFFFESYFAIPTVISLVSWLALQPFTKRFLNNSTFIRKAVTSTKDMAS